VLRDLFGLTAAEAEVARALAGGATKSSVALARGIAETTVRTQVRAVLTKTGAANLRDLERLLAGLSGPLTLRPPRPSTGCVRCSGARRRRSSASWSATRACTASAACALIGPKPRISSGAEATGSSASAPQRAAGAAAPRGSPRTRR
jgi:DNA-binding CsgD family transcriptional regulator